VPSPVKRLLNVGSSPTLSIQIFIYSNMEYLYVIGKVGLFFLLSWLIGLTIIKSFNLVEGKMSNTLFILRGGIILVSLIIIHLYFK
jgi:hypothetical protein